MLDEFKEAFRIKPDLPDVLDQIGRQGRSLWVHMLLASQDIDARAEKLLENVGYRLVLRQNTSASASAAGVPQAVNLPREGRCRVLRTGSADDLIRFRAESLWRDYRRPGTDGDDVIAPPSRAETSWSRNCLPPPGCRCRSTDPVASGQARNRRSRSRSQEDETTRCANRRSVRVILDQLREIDFRAVPVCGSRRWTCRTRSTTS